MVNRIGAPFIHCLNVFEIDLQEHATYPHRWGLKAGKSCSITSRKAFKQWIVSVSIACHDFLYGYMKLSEACEVKSIDMTKWSFQKHVKSSQLIWLWSFQKCVKSSQLMLCVTVHGEIKVLTLPGNIVFRIILNLIVCTYEL